MTATARPRRRRRWKRFILAAGLSMAVLLLLCWKTGEKLRPEQGVLPGWESLSIGVRAVKAKILEVDPFLLMIAFVVSAAVHILAGAHKWYLILRGMGCETTYSEVLFVRMGSDPIRIVAPFKTGELSNIAYFWRQGKLPFARSASWVLFDKALNIGGTFFWLTVGLVVYFAFYGTADMSHKALYVGAGLAGAAVTVALLPFVSGGARRLMKSVAGKVHPKLGRAMESLLGAFEDISWRRKLALLAYGVGFQLRPLLVMGLLMVAYRADFTRLPGLPAMLAWGSVAVACSNVPYFQWGAGAREWALTTLFPAYLVNAKDLSTLVAIGMWMALSIHFVPAFFGLPVLGSFLGTLETGHEPEEFINGNEEEEAGENGEAPS